MHQIAASLPAGDVRSEELRFSHRCRSLGAGGATALAALLHISVGPVGEAAAAVDPAAPAPGLQAGARFLADAARDAVEAVDLARMIGCFAFVCMRGAAPDALRVSLRNDRGPHVSAWLARPDFAVERTVFGAAHILFENDVLGLYVLEIAPGAAIPAHFHRVMQECELVLDHGLLLQGRPARAGDAFVWPAGCVHAYANPGDAPKGVLCIDRPRFIPEDEVVVAGPVDLAPARPERSYLA